MERRRFIKEAPREREREIHRKVISCLRGERCGGWLRRGKVVGRKKGERVVVVEAG